MKLGKLEPKPAGGSSDGPGEASAPQTSSNGLSGSGNSGVLTNGAIEAVTEQTAAELRNIIEIQVGG